MKKHKPLAHFLMPATSFKQNLVLFFFPESIFPHFDNKFHSVSFWPWGHSLFLGTNARGKNTGNMDGT